MSADEEIAPYLLKVGCVALLVVAAVIVLAMYVWHHLRLV